MINPWNEMHSLIIYILFGYSLLLPLVLICLKIFRITSPLQRLRLYLIAFLTPPSSFILYHTILTKRCEAGLPPIWAEGAFHILCVISAGMLRAVLPLTGLFLILGMLKAAAAVLMIRRLDSEALTVSAEGYARVTKTLFNLCAKLHITPPRLIFSGRDNFAAFTTGLLTPVLVINHKIADTLNDQELQVLLSHELMHIVHRDTLKHWLLYLVRDLTFINPFSGILLKKYLLEKETICDQRAARLLKQPAKDYAATLIKIWRLILDSRSPRYAFGSAFAGDGNGLEYRVSALLQSRQEKNMLPSLLTIIVGAVIFATTLLFLGLIC